VSEKIIVLVSDKGDSKHGEISVMDDPRKAEKLVETLLEAGFEQERIHVFAGRESDFQVSQRPIVALVGEDEEDEPQAGATAQVAAAPEQVAAAPVQEASPPEPVADADETETGDTQGEESKTSETEEEVAATAETAAPVKFSSLFRSA
jgi:hypothetical protein